MSILTKQSKIWCSFLWYPDSEVSVLPQDQTYTILHRISAFSEREFYCELLMESNVSRLFQLFEVVSSRYQWVSRDFLMYGRRILPSSNSSPGIES